MSNDPNERWTRFGGFNDNNQGATAGDDDEHPDTPPAVPFQAPGRLGGSLHTFVRPDHPAPADPFNVPRTGNNLTEGLDYQAPQLPSNNDLFGVGMGFIHGPAPVLTPAEMFDGMIAVGLAQNPTPYNPGQQQPGYGQGPHLPAPTYPYVPANNQPRPHNNNPQSQINGQPQRNPLNVLYHPHPHNNNAQPQVNSQPQRNPLNVPYQNPYNIIPRRPEIPRPVASYPPPPAERSTSVNNIGKRIEDPNTTYGVLLQGKPPANVKPPKGFAIGLIEICTFFPSWFQLPMPIVRAWMNTWNRRPLAKAQLDPLNQLSFKNLETTENKVQKQLGVGGECFYGMAKWNGAKARQDYPKINDLTADDWLLRTHYEGGTGNDTEFCYISLRDVYTSVPRASWPTGEDRLVLTMCLEFAYNNPGLDLDTSHFDWIRRRNNFTAPPGLVLDASHDIAALQRLENRVPTPPKP
ncbi:hypothetical protein LTR37_021103 [Vermiconidia calcicola]|uniref:Uncharacterized protein n=1 Tax=Vermiconidia calcicola TaxID=1690605 RepID=A0ACC3MCG9_9PEZI|nr:hypothetical protein LTR37_021103 [Vermiconidia calcicola]